jgi:hypothetical protein
MDEFLRAAGFPWVVRKAALKFGGSAVDLVSHVGALMRVTSLNAKGSWSREYDLDREVVQSNAEGTPCKTTSWWEGRWGAPPLLPGLSAVPLHACTAATRDTLGACAAAFKGFTSAAYLYSSIDSRRTPIPMPPCPASAFRPRLPLPHGGLPAGLRGVVAIPARHLHGGPHRAAPRPRRSRGRHVVVSWRGAGVRSATETQPCTSAAAELKTVAGARRPPLHTCAPPTFPSPPKHPHCRYFDRMETLQRHVARGGGSLHQQIESGGHGVSAPAAACQAG